MKSTEFVALYLEGRRLHDQAVSDCFSELSAALLRRAAALGRFAQLQFSWTAPRASLRS